MEFVDHLRANDDAMWRTCKVGHLTGSAIVVDDARTSVLLTLHPRVGRWVQVGGHCEEGDESLSATALREASEESGIVGLTIDQTPIDLDIHAFDCPRRHPNRHFDVRFVCVAPPGAIAQISDESLDLAWFSFDALPDQIDAATRRLIRHAQPSTSL